MTDRETLLAELELLVATMPGEAEDRWLNLLRALGLKFGHYIGLVEAVKDEEWRGKKDPKKYLIGAAKYSIERAERGPRWLVFDGSEAALDKAAMVVESSSYLNESPDRFIDTLPKEITLTFEPSEHEQAELRAPNGCDFPAYGNNFDCEGPLLPNTGLNWEKLYRGAGLDEWERRSMEYRRRGVSREIALASQPDEDSRLALQAAWKRVDRKRTRLLRAAKHLIRAYPRPQRPEESYPDLGDFKWGSGPVVYVPSFDPIPWWSTVVPLMHPSRRKNKKSVPDSAFSNLPNRETNCAE